MGEGTCFCNLQVISFRNFFLGDRGLDGLLPLFKFARALRHLSLASNGMREAFLQHLSTALLEPTFLFHLISLDLSHNPISSASMDDLLKLLPQRKGLLLIGLTGTALADTYRQQAMRQILANFARAEKADMLDACQFVGDLDRFADRELWVRCTQVLKERHGSGVFKEGNSSNDS